ncbi:MAG: hypothetical protein PHY34_00405 [Patescibacteria group bacterium]|nr:hypothetical protein [Patescibacteria group bacterium]MDD5715907.1 hypothetical protein [Patescibacteria group bacterium]
MKRVLERLNLAGGQVQVLPSGYYSEVVMIIQNGSPITVRIVKDKQGLTKQPEVALVANRIEEYHKRLRDAGVSTTTSLSTHLLEGEAGWDLIVLTPYVGDDIQHRMQAGENAVGLTRKILVELEKCFQYRFDGFALQLGIDSKPSNFCMRTEADTEVRYIDLVPPRTRLEDGTPLLEINLPTSQEAFEFGCFRYFDLRGVLLVLQNQVSRLVPTQRPKIKRLILETATRHGAADFFRESKAEQFASASPNDQEVIIQGLQRNDVYPLREIACEMATAGQISSDSLETFFRQTHFFTDFPPEDQMTEVKQALVASLRTNKLRSPQK